MLLEDSGRATNPNERSDRKRTRIIGLDDLPSSLNLILLKYYIMLFEVIKAISDSPEKIAKGVLNTIKLMFAFLLSIHFYGVFLVPFHGGQTTEWQIWLTWLEPGRILLWVFFFAASYVLLFRFLDPLLTAAVITWQRRWHPKIKGDQRLAKVVFKMLHLVGIAVYNEKKDWVNGTRHTRELIDFLGRFRDGGIDNSDDGVPAFLEIWVLLVFFAVYYFSAGFGSHYALSALVILSLVVMPLLYALVAKVIAFLSEEARTLIFFFEALDSKRVAELALQRFGCPLTDKIDQAGKITARVFTFGGKEYQFLYGQPIGKLTVVTLKLITGPLLGGQLPIALFIKGGMAPETEEVLRSYGQKVMVVCFQTAEEVPDAIFKAFPGGSPQHVLLQ